VQPELRVRSSGHGGSGYKHPVTEVIVPGVTTVLKKLEKSAITQWAVDNTAAYAVANVDALLSRTEEKGFGFLRFYWNRDPLKGDYNDIRNYSNGVLNDAAELGTMIHEWIAADLSDDVYPDVTKAPAFFWEMVAEWDRWKTEHDVKPILTEATVWSEQYGYAGTLDGLWEVDGVKYLLDIKSSRNTWDEHYMQLAALGAADYLLVKSAEGVWSEEVIPSYSGYAFLRIRPSDTDKEGNYVAPYCELKVINDAEIPLHFEAFLGLLKVSHAQNELKEMRKSSATVEGF